MHESKLIGMVLVLLSLVLIIRCLFRKNEPFFNLFEVFKKHFQLFKGCKTQYVVFYVLPFIFSLGLSMVYSAAKEVLAELSVILGIILSVLLTVLSILSGFDFTTVKNEEQRRKGKVVVNDTINAITFSTFLCIFLMLYNMLLTMLYGGDFSWIPFDLGMIKIAASTLAYYVFSVICLTFLLIVKQMSKIIQFNLSVNRNM